MSRSVDAIINPKLLVWAREEAYLGSQQASEALKVSIDKLQAWEDGELTPTVKQLRQIAKKYKQSFAAFYLPEPPISKRTNLKDYRRLPGDIILGITPSLAFEIRDAVDRRQISLEMYEELQSSPPDWKLTIKLSDSPEEVGKRVRDYLGIDCKEQRKWRDKRIAFNTLRELFEKAGVLVLQSTRVETSEMRGFSVGEFPLPVIVVNRKDSYAGRSFSMFHELAHTMLRSSGICDMKEGYIKAEEDRYVEIFCNHVASACLVPETYLIKEDIVRNHQGSEWSDESLERLSGYYGVSKEVILRKLLDLGLTNNSFYKMKRNEFIEEYKNLRKRKGFVAPAVDVVSSSGKLYVSLVLDAYTTNRITPSDVSDYLGVRLKHLKKITEAISSHE